jgi:DNA-binding MarR family transcriptional regulator
MARNTSLKSHQWDSAIDPEIAPLFLSLQWVQAQSMDLMHPLLIKYGLSLAEFDVLATLRNAPAPHAMTPSQIQHEVVITSGGLTKVMLQLEARNLVVRHQSQDDLRVKPVCLTPEGATTIEAAMTEMICVTGAWIRNALDPQQTKLLTSLLRAVLDSSIQSKENTKAACG